MYLIFVIQLKSTNNFVIHFDSRLANIKLMKNYSVCFIVNYYIKRLLSDKKRDEEMNVEIYRFKDTKIECEW